MQKYNKAELYRNETECYGCETMTPNLSGMCDKCGGSARATESERPQRIAYSLSRAYDIIERSSQV